MDCTFCLKGSNSWWEGDLRRNFAQLSLGSLYWECLGHELALVTVPEVFAKVNSTQSPSPFYNGAVLWTSSKCGSFSPRSRYIVLFLLLLFACFCLFVLLSENFLQTCGFNHYLTKKKKTSPNLTCLRISKLNCKKKKLRRALRRGECLQLLAPFFGWYLAFDEKRVRKRLPHRSTLDSYHR